MTVHLVALKSFCLAPRANVAQKYMFMIKNDIFYRLEKAQIVSRSLLLQRKPNSITTDKSSSAEKCNNFMPFVFCQTNLTDWHGLQNNCAQCTVIQQVAQKRPKFKPPPYWMEQLDDSLKCLLASFQAKVLYIQNSLPSNFKFSQKPSYSSVYVVVCCVFGTFIQLITLCRVLRDYYPFF